MIRKFDYTYNLQNFIASQKVYGESSSLIEWKEYEYDTLGRLTKAKTKDNGTGQITDTYEFFMDDVGNLTYEVDDGTTNLTHLYKNNDMNELIKIKEDEVARTNPGTVDVWGTVSVDSGATITLVKVNNQTVSHSGGYFSKDDISLNTNQTQNVTAIVTDSRGYTTTHTVTLYYDQMADIGYAYDLRGNMIYKSEHGEETLYIYDARDFLKEVRLPNKDEVHIVTGPDGKMLRRSFYDYSAGTWESANYFHSGYQGIADFDEDWNLEAYYIPGPGIDRIEIMHKDGEDCYFVRDHLGSVRLVIDSNCNIVEQYEYSTYGELTIKNGSGQTITTSAIGNRHTYTGREWDEDLGLYYYRARWYDPRIRRFTQKDIVHFTNRYIYVLNNPMNCKDPLGRDIWIEELSSKYNHKAIYFDNYDGTESGYDLLMGNKWHGWPWDSSGNVRKLPDEKIDNLKNHYLPPPIPGQEGVDFTYVHYRCSKDQTKRGKKWAHERYINQDYPYKFPFKQCWTFVENALIHAGYPLYDPTDNSWGPHINDLYEGNE